MTPCNDDDERRLRKTPTMVLLAGCRVHQPASQPVLQRDGPDEYESKQATSVKRQWRPVPSLSEHDLVWHPTLCRTAELASWWCLQQAKIATMIMLAAATVVVENFECPDLSRYPPPPVLWLTCLIDTACSALRCGDWRQRYFGVEENDGSWLSHRLQPLSEILPHFTTYADFSREQCQPSDSGRSLSAWSKLLSVPDFSCMYRYAFETPSTALGDLSTPTALLTLVALVLVLRQIKSVLLPLFRSWGRRAGRAAHGPEWEADNEERISKFGEYVFRLLYHFCISVFGVIYFWDKSWWAPGGTVTLFAGFPYHPVEPGMAIYYLLQAAYNLDALVHLLEISFRVRWKKRQETNSKFPGRSLSSPSIEWSPDVRGDFREMLVHHVVTNVLVIGSSRCRLTRIGSMVFLVHDLSDVPVDLSKLANFLKYKITTIACFTSMVLMWLATRLYVLPVTIYGAVLTKSHYVMQEGLSPVYYVFYRHTFYVLVAFLILLHFAWFLMFLRMAYMIVTKFETHDYSEHKSGEDYYQKQNGQKMGNGANGNGVSHSAKKEE